MSEVLSVCHTHTFITAAGGRGGATTADLSCFSRVRYGFLFGIFRVKSEDSHDLCVKLISCAVFVVLLKLLLLITHKRLKTLLTM